MPEYAWLAVDAGGRVSRGRMVARGEPELEWELEAQGLELIDCRVAAARERLPSKRIRRRDIIEMLIAWRAMERAGVPLLEALHDSMDEIANPALREIVRRMHRDMEEGASLVDAAARHPKVFDAMSLGILRAGMESGRLEAAFDYLIRHHAWVDKMRKTVFQLMLEPSILVVVIIAFILLMFGFVVPKILETITMFGVELPWPTRAMIWLNQFFQAWGLWIIGAAVALALVMPMLYLRWPAFRYRVDDWKLRLPWFGPLNRMIVASRFSHHLAAMFRSGIPALEALEIVSRAVGNAVAEREILEARDRIVDGQSIYDAMTKTTVFSPMVLRMLRVGEESGNIDGALDYVAEYYDEEVPRRMERVFALITPAVTIVLGAVVLMVALSVFLPMLGMIDKVHMMRH
ncbi:MAG: type II secretion system F family protein [Mariprofundaceae bacterium]